MLWLATRQLYCKADVFLEASWMFRIILGVRDREREKERKRERERGLFRIEQKAVDSCKMHPAHFPEQQMSLNVFCSCGSSGEPVQVPLATVSVFVGKNMAHRLVFFTPLSS